MTNYPQEFKDQLVALHRSGRTYMELGKEFNLAPTSISNWVRAAEKQEQAAGRVTREGGESEEMLLGLAPRSRGRGRWAARSTTEG